jgi:alpha-tubulin suppressor-like RCC1 family protein
MPATNYTPIQLYRSTTSGNTPLAANMSAGEIALNIADNDMSMWMENASGTVKRFFNNPAALKYPTADGTSGQVIVTDGSGNLSFATPAGGALTNNVRQAVTSSATTTLNLNSGNVIDLTMAANITTLSFTNVPASGTPILIQIVVRNASDGTAYTIVWPNSVYWSGQYAATTISTVQTAPTLATGANGVTVIALLTTDGGTKWRGWVEATIPGGVLAGLYSWGYGSSGQLGQNSTASLSSPVQVGALVNWALVQSGIQFCLAIKTDGTLWSWGGNSGGRLGLNDIVNRSSPVQVGTLTNWAKVATGNAHSVAVKTDGTLWSWGYGNYGRLGQNNTINQSSPVQVGALTNWASVSGGLFCCAAVKTDGTLWSWGYGKAGQLGQNNTINQSSPVQVGALTDWALISQGNYFCAAIKTNGSLWSWGSATAGRLGQNNTTYLSSPVQVGALTNWSKVTAGRNAFCAAVKTDGTLWSWGAGSSGQLGQNNTTTFSSPVQVGALTTWASVSGGSEFSAAIKTDGTLWIWGYGNAGRLGQNDTVSRSSPVQIGALTNWASVSLGDAFSVATSAIPVNPA